VVENIFSKRDKETAIRVLSHSKHVRNWCDGEAKAYGIEKGSNEYVEFVRVKSVEYARRLLKQ